MELVGVFMDEAPSIANCFPESQGTLLSVMLTSVVPCRLVVSSKLTVLLSDPKQEKCHMRCGRPKDQGTVILADTGFDYEIENAFFKVVNF